jgi:hypothetical protein
MARTKEVSLSRQDEKIQRRFRIPRYLMDYLRRYKESEKLSTDNVALHCLLIEFSKIRPL